MIWKKITKDNIVDELKEYFRNQPFRISNYSTVYQYMWNASWISSEYAIEDDTLLMRCRYDGRIYFSFPLPLNLENAEPKELAAIKKIEDFCTNNNLELNYINIPEERLEMLTSRYQNGIHIYMDRQWQDYLYNIDDFKDFKGRKFSGQRNHINKFRSKYPNAQFKTYTAEDKPRIMEFFNEFEETQFSKEDLVAIEELKKAREVMNDFDLFDIFCGYYEIDGKIVSVAVGEICKDTIIEHIEKSLREYDGIYASTVQAFARTFGREGILYVNREEDIGDMGLRKSKMQYHPCRMIKKYILFIDKPLSNLTKMPVIKSGELVLRRIKDSSAEDYARLAGDIERNKYWGYDYRSDWKGSPEDTPDAAFFLSLVRKTWRERTELSLGIYLHDKLIGEVVLHKFTYTFEAEIGMRLLEEYVGHGYAQKAVKIMSDYAFANLSIEKINAKCYKENSSSAASLKAAGMLPAGEDDTYFYFYRTPEI